MFKSVFRKFLFSYLLVSIVSLIGISVVIGYFYQEQAYNQRKAALTKMAQRVNELTDMLIAEEITGREYMRNLRYLETEERVKVRLITREGNERIEGMPDRNTPPYPQGQFFRFERTGEMPGPGLDHIITRDTVSEVFQDKEKFLVRNIKDDQSFIVLGVPFKNGGDVERGVFLYTPIESTARTIERMYSNIGFTFLAIVLPTILVLYFLSKKFTRPLVAMSTAADKLANGDFSHRVNVNNKDEVGRLADSLNNMAERLQQLEQARRDFIANVSHELRTPLTTILANTQGIIDGVVTREEVNSFLKVNLEETKRLSLLVNELIELSTLEKGKMKLDKQITDISELVSDITRQMELKALEKNLRLSANIEEGLKGNIDKNRIRQVMINLIDNAVRYTPEGGEVVVSINREDQYIKIEVSDTGCGISKEHLPMIFERFYKAGDSRGSGIGLSISKLIIEAHNGRIWVESEEGKGTKFLIIIPL